MRVSLLRTSVCVVIFISFLQACSSYSPRSILWGSEETADRSPSRSTRPEIRTGDPWKAWEYRLLLDGNPVKGKILLQGDALHERGDLRKALQSYQQDMRKKLTPMERESAALRTASTQLSLGDAKQALATVSSTFGGPGGDVRRVHPLFALVLAYAYAAQNDLNQSLAWFSELGKNSGDVESVRGKAPEGMRSVLRSASPQAFDSLSLAWSRDPLAGPLIAEERKLRSKGAAPGKFGEIRVVPISEEAPAETPQGLETGVLRIGVMVPLSGEHAALGKSIRDGISLAVAANNEGVQLIERDSGSDPARMEDLISSMSLTDEVQALIGPLLSNQAPIAAEAARMRGVPMITFSKNSSFSPGGGVFRLGVTGRSQALSLSEAAVDVGGMTRIAVVYPDTPAGIEHAAEFRSALQAKNLSPVFEQSYPPGQEDRIMAIAEEVSNVEPEAIFCPDGITAAARFFSSIPEPVRSRITPLGTAAWDEGRQLRNSAAALEGAVFPSIFFSQSEDPAVQQFVESFRAKYGSNPDLLAAQGFDAAMLLLAAGKTARDRSGMEASLRQIGSYEGLTGRLSVSPAGEIERTYRVVVLKSGKLSEFSSNEKALGELRKRRSLFQPPQSAQDRPPIIRSY